MNQQSQQLPLLNIECREKARSLCKASAIPAEVVIQVTEGERGKTWIGMDLFSFCMCVMNPCYAKLVWWPCFPFQPWILESLPHASPLSTAQAAKPCEFECHGPSLVFSPTIKPHRTAPHLTSPHPLPPSLPSVVCQWNISSINWEENGRVTSPCSRRACRRAC